MAMVVVLGFAAGALAAGRSAARASASNPCKVPLVRHTVTTYVTRTLTTTVTTTTPITTPPPLTTTQTTTTPAQPTTTAPDTTTPTITTPPATTPTTTAPTTTAPTFKTTVHRIRRRVKRPVVRHYVAPFSPWSPADGVRQLSNGASDTIVAEANGTYGVHLSPDLHSQVITHLRYDTPDQEALQTYLVVGQQRVHGRLWLWIVAPMRPNGTLGWVPRSYLGTFMRSNEQIIVQRALHRLVLCRAEHAIFTSPVGVGRPGMRTPPGRFWVTEAFQSDDPSYGPWAFGTSDYATEAAVHAGFGDGGLVGIHGTNKPWLIPGNPSHGCVRLPDANILKLESLVSIGASIWVQ